MPIDLYYKGERLSQDLLYAINAPIGAIVIWSGTEDTIPEGWSICNGQNGTLDLRDKFVLGAGESHSVGESGGSEEVTLTVGQMPTHRHDVPSAAIDSTKTDASSSRRFLTKKGVVNEGYNTALVGSSEPHPNMPPYYTLLYIQKIGVAPSDYAMIEQVEEIVQEVLSELPAGSNVPTGGIIIWSGASNAVPDGWALCDGTNGTPDLRGRFVLGESDDHDIGEIGGSEEVTLTADIPPYYVLAYIMYVGGDAMW